MSASGITDLATAWRILCASKWLVASIVAVFTIGAVAAAFLTRPVYRARVVMIPADSDESPAGLGAMLGNLGGLAALGGINLGGGDNSVEAIATLKSRQFTENFISQNQLISRLFYRKWDAENQTWSVTGDEVPTLWDAWLYFDRKVRRVSDDKRSGLVVLEIDWIDAAEAAAWANELVARLNETMRARMLTETDASIRHLEKELARTDVVALQQAISRLIETYVKKQTVATIRPEFAFRVVDPAAAPDDDDFVRPKRALYLVGGPVAGLLVALFVLLIRDFLRREMLGQTQAQ